MLRQSHPQDSCEHFDVVGASSADAILEQLNYFNCTFLIYSY
jgi:hypothetical protein